MHKNQTVRVLPLMAAVIDLLGENQEVLGSTQLGVTKFLERIDDMIDDREHSRIIRNLAKLIIKGRIKQADVAKEELKCKVRGIEFSLMQRCAAHVSSKNDVEESYTAGKTAVIKAVEGMTDHMVGFERTDSNTYECKMKLINLSDVANTEKTIPSEWIINDGTFVSKDFIDYALPLIQGSPDTKLEEGLPRFAKLKKIRVEKK